MTAWPRSINTITRSSDLSVPVSGRLREVRHRQRREEPEHVRGRVGAAATPRLPGEALLSAAAASERKYSVVDENSGH